MSEQATALDIVKDLEALGRTPEEIANRLIAKGITGMKCNNACCPLANYLNALHPGHHFRVTSIRIEIDGVGRCPTTDAVMDFVPRFDRGEWPLLVG